MLGLMNPSDRIPKDHPLRRIKSLADEILRQMGPTFNAMYSKTGRPSIPPEQLLKGSLLMALYTIRSERQFCEQLNYNLLYRWFLDMDMLDETFDPTTFGKNRSRLMTHDAAGRFFELVVEAARAAGLTSNEHFSVDGTLIDAAASLKSFKSRDDDKTDPPGGGGDNPDVDFHGEKRSNETHESTTDPEAKLMRKGLGKEAKLSFAGHGIIENKNGILVAIEVTHATGKAEREAALAMLDGLNLPTGATLGADKGYDTRDFVQACRDRNLVPHVAQKTKYSALDERTTRHEGYRVSQRKRKRIEEVWGWAKVFGGLRRTRFVGLAKTRFTAQLIGAAYNLIRIARLVAA